MMPLVRLASALVPLTASDIDTDQIIPAQFVNVQGQEALARALFANLRAADPGFVLNRPGMPGRQVLLTGRNFGCGSSREAAAWAIGAAGFRALVGPSFNATFWNNCVQNGIAPLTAPQPDWQRLCDAHAADPALVVEIDLQAQRVEAPAAGFGFDVALEPFARELLLRGLDELDYLLERRPAIRDFERMNPGSNSIS